MYLSTFFLAVYLSFAGIPLAYLPGTFQPDTLSAGAAEIPDTLDVAVVAAGRSAVITGSAPVREMTTSAILRTGVKTLDEAVRTFAGISVKDYGGIGGLKTVSVRNLGSQHTAVCYDGIAISDAQNGQVDIGRFNLDNIGSVSVSIGGTDDIFRSARQLTSAGFLEIKSLEPDFSQGPVNISARMGIASFGTYTPHVMYQQRLGPSWSLAASADYIHSKGNYPFVLKNGNLVTDEIRLNSDVSTLNTEINLYGDMGSGGKLAVKAFYTDSERGLPGSVVLYTQNPTERLWNRNLVANALYSNGFGEKWKLRASLGYSRAYNRYVNTDPKYTVPEDDNYLQQEYSASATIQYEPLKVLRFAVAEDFFVNRLDSNIPECPFPVRFSSVTAVSAQYSAGRLTATAGVVGTYNHETVREGDPAADRKRLSPYVSASFKILKNEELRVRASFKDGFRVPTFNDLYYARVGNRSLRPEKAMQTNLGITWFHKFKRVSLSMTTDGYYNNVRDKIVAIPTMFIWRMRNIGKVRMAGLDITASMRCSLTGWLDVSAGANWSFQYAVDVTDSEAKNYMHQIPYTPRHTGGGNLCLETPWINVSYLVVASGERFSEVQNIQMNRMEPYADHGISVNHTFEFGRRHRFRLYAGAEALNLGNVNYDIIRYYPMPGRNYRLTVRISY